MPGGLLDKVAIRCADHLDRQWGWDHLPRPLAILTLMGLRMRLRRENLIDTSGVQAGWGPEAEPTVRSKVRSADGSDTDPYHREMGRAGSPLGRNMEAIDLAHRDVLEPDLGKISNDLLARREFVPAPGLNLLMAAWIQFEVHDWMSHGPNQPPDKAPPWTVAYSDNRRGFPRTMEVRQTQVLMPDARSPTYANTQSHWWDASQVYGSSPEIADQLRTRKGGHLALTSRKLVPFDPARLPEPLRNAPELAGVVGNWWVGLAMFHTLFMREHNAICDCLASAHHHWDDNRLFNTARLVNAALIAKIHTLEWTSALLANPRTELALRINWWGLQGERLHKWFGSLTKDEEISGIPGSGLYYHGAPYAITEEFVSVYRMHTLLPDTISVRRSSDDQLIETFAFDQVAGPRTLGVLNRISMEDLFYSFARSNPGAIVLHNYPNHLRNFDHLNERVDLAAIDVLRDRERGVPRYNEFRRRVRLPAATRFEDFSDDPDVVAELRQIYCNPEQVDLMVGLFAEKRPDGFAISETAFRIFILMASRRLKSDRFFTYDYRPEVYSEEGMKWIENNTLSSVLQRHYPSLKSPLRGVDNAFKPWYP